MPSVVSIEENKWKDAPFSANFSDEHFGFLGGFQEILPDDLISKKKKKVATKVKSDSNETKNKPDKEENEPSKKIKAKIAKGDSDKLEQSKQIKEKEVSKRKASKKEEEGESTKPKKKKIRNKTVEKDDKISTITSTPQKENIDLSKWEQFCLRQEILNALEELKFSTPTPIQDAVLMPAVRDQLDILGTAETGSGKTIAFVIPVLSRLLLNERVGKGPRALVLAPTRELAVQILATFKKFADHAKTKVISIVGGLSEAKQMRIMEKQMPEILVATPGRLWDLIKQAESGSYLSDFSGLQCIVVDEADRMVEQGHFHELSKILEKVKSMSTYAQIGKIQTLVFSATLTYVVPEKNSHTGKMTNERELSVREKTKLIVDAAGLRQQHKVIDLTKLYGTAEKIVETRINCSGLLEKDLNLVYLLKRYAGRTLIFTNSIDSSRRLYGILTLLGITPMMLHANMIQRQRLRNLERFTNQPNSILLATDVAARGLDIKGIEHVIHYHVPRTAEMYIHRSGRTARANERGLTVLMVDPTDAHLYRKLCKNLNRDAELPVFPIDNERLLNALYERVKLASDLESLNHRTKKIKLEETWIEKMARAADLDFDDRNKDHEGANNEFNDLLRKQDKLKASLKFELKTPLPGLNQNLPKTSFITPTISQDYKKEISLNALDDLHQQLDSIKELKKRTNKQKNKKVKGKISKK